MKLTLERLAGYLPYGLKVWHTDWDCELIMNATGSGSNNLSIEDVAEYAKPILRPLSDLIKVIVYDGYSLVPVARLLDISISMNWSSTSYLSFDHGKNEYWTYFKNNKPSSVFGYNEQNKCFYMHDSNGDKKSVKNQKELFDFLHELHFDIHGLIENNLAIDINNLK